LNENQIADKQIIESRAGGGPAAEEPEESWGEQGAQSQKG